MSSVPEDEGEGYIKKAVTIIAVLLLVFIAFAGLRVYGFYQNEKANALHEAQEAKQEAETEQSLLDREKRQWDCNAAWSAYELKQLQEEHVRITQGETAYLQKKAEDFKDKPVCDGYSMSVDTAFQLTNDKLEHIQRIVKLQDYAEAETAYSTNRRAQTRTLLRKIWASITGEHVSVFQRQ